ncbi:MAG: FAD-dependent oxidoreductase [Nisaea sp.]|uniref:GcvT family protein n=1 Tax=Nisaea sp. TaxID=2024842 RepID=UPI001B23F4B9|nr:FAD-dependent oxidoreductase [Nisaea sp.]MBO6561780.1 FAD-dependent oxidoreductase [Nisaea sp.]
MKSHTQVVVIGGGVVGCSVLYHLTKLGWKDVVLVERSELTSGSTWHAAGGMHTLNSDPNVTKLQKYTIDLYKEIEEISGQATGVHLSGGIMAAGTQSRVDYLKTMVAKSKYMGLDIDFISLDEVQRLHPLCDAKHFVGAVYDPNEGHVDPSGVTNAYAISARKGGAEIYRHTKVEELVAEKDGTWSVVTDKGTIRAEKVVNAGGLWAREVGRMVGLELPVLAMEHHYLITEPLDEIKALENELPHLIDFEAEIYTRQEGVGFLLGTYEKACVPWSPHETPWDFGHELLQPDLDRIAPSLDVAYQHFPFLANAGVKSMINGPFTFAPDGNPLVGPVPGLRNMYLACGVMAGFSQGGGVGLALAQWMIEGEPDMDVFAMDCARFGNYATKGYAYEKVKENYSRRFSITFPNEELKAGRPHRMTAIYDRLKAKNAVFGASYGLEHALWFAPEGMEPVENVTFGRSNAFGPVGEECRAVRESVGLLEISNFAKYEVTGEGAEAWLSELMTNRMPSTGRIVLTPMLNRQGKIIGDFTIAKLAENRFMIFGSGVAEMFHLRWFWDHLPESGVEIRSRCQDLVGLSIAGPKAAELLAKVTHEDVSTAAMPFMCFREMNIGLLHAMVGRLSFTGERGYEIWVRPDYLISLYDLLVEAGAEFGLRHFGGRALNSLRLEKSFGGFLREFTPDYSPLEAGLERFVDMSKNSFIGREALAAEQAAGGGTYRLITLTIDVEEIDAIADEPIFHGGKAVGWVTSGGFGHTVGKSIALGYVPREYAEKKDGFEVEILGKILTAHRVSAPLHDPKGALMRG